MRQPNLLLQCKLKISTRNYQKLTKSILFQDDSNGDNLDACLSKTSKTLGQCILDCDNDSSCETACVSAFKDEHSECPCQVRRIVQMFIVLFYRKNAHLVALVTTTIATCPKRKQFWHFIPEALQHRQFWSNQMVNFKLWFLDSFQLRWCHWKFWIQN